MPSAKSYRRQELREFLMARRARISPTEAGLPDGGARRRTPGLRREEVAVLAGVGVSWYQWLEQGREITVSPQVLDAVARVLKLNGSERRHLYGLAGLNPPLPEAAPGSDFCDGLHRLIDAWMPFPAHVMDAYWNIIAFNDAAGLAFAFTPDDTNCLVTFFTSPRYRGRVDHWDELAASVVAQYRAAVSERPDDEGFRAVVEELAAVSPEFAEIWARGDVQASGQTLKEIIHPTAGSLHFESTQLRIPARPDLTIVMHNPLPGTDTAAKLERLTSPEGRRDTMRPVAG
ncbi:helix-turn-helix transcriptional regulator [Streptomyces sp. H10-C2]|uniref:helix-turn-helix transcriptional regulator n=1 Tax=unclassified Streptomyces TaxID=2593676 RepID=UPI0024BBA497|nr:MULTISPECIES: helix-turn-helix transcriptional regulator [unclassified Streptomyces]MDJ0347218.1 helix-turn-helix transcriptional regulator [Streptomyces sp. PH10-H1]MDJ0373245.1 helix-turn-helix transcriptional regulator [Streptomyces sp. H10-C2]